MTASASHYGVLAECRRPWKLATFAIGLGLLIVGSYVTPAPDWDIPISIIMATFTYLTAGWSAHVIAERQWQKWPLMMFLVWWCVDGCYAAYWSLADPEALDFMREANWPASLSLYLMCALVWFWNGTARELLTVIKTSWRP
jgi:hypothetical protein